MKSKKLLVLQSFYPNKLIFFGASMFFAGISIVIWEKIINPEIYNEGGIYKFLWSKLPIEMQSIFLFLSISMQIATPLAILIARG